jgi:hypothetical protein
VGAKIALVAWPWWHKQTGPDAHRIRELLRAVWDLHAMYGADDPWLWRGQANSAYPLEPAIHTRIRAHAPFDDTQVENFTVGLLLAARQAGLDRHEETNLPDMALLALLQHHGAATPLFDISLDPVVGLYMATVSPNPEDDERDGALFAIRRPHRHIADFDSRSFREIYPWIGDDVVLYSAPDVSERLRIQRGHFLIGRVSTADNRVTIPLTLDSGPLNNTWLRRRMDARGSTGAIPAATSDVAVFRVNAEFKQDIRLWLEARSGLTRDFVYPTPWHQPYLDRFAACHGRMAAF